MDHARPLRHQKRNCSDLLQWNCPGPRTPCVLAIVLVVLLVVLLVVGRKSDRGEKKNEYEDGCMRSRRNSMLRSQAPHDCELGGTLKVDLGNFCTW